MNSKHLLLSVPIFVIAALVFAFLRASGEQPDAHARAMSADRAGMPSRQQPPAMVRAAAEAAPVAAAERTPDVEDLLGRLHALERAVAAQRQTDTLTPREAVETAGSLEEQMQQERERTMQTSAFLENHFVSEAKDPAWSLQAERQVSGAFDAEDLAGNHLQGISCQATLCRIRSQHDDLTAERTFMSRLGRLEVFSNGEAFSQRTEQADGSIEIVTYVTRGGHRLPDLQ